MVGWHHRLNGHDFERDGEGQAPGDGEDRETWHAAVYGFAKGQSDTTEQLN